MGKTDGLTLTVQQKWSSCSWLLLREFVRQHKENEKARDEAVAAGDLAAARTELPLPSIPYWKCRQIMTRTDFIEGNAMTITIPH